MQTSRHRRLNKFLIFSIRDTLLTMVILSTATLFCFLIRTIDDSIIVISMLYVLAVACISRITSGYFYGVFSCLFGVICDNYIFTYPYFDLDFSIPTYPVSFLSMFAVSLLICTMTTQLKDREKLMIEAKTQKMRSNLLLAVSHDLRTPLTSILGIANTILDNYDMIDQERRKELLTELTEEADWLIRMVENLLFITKMQKNAANLSKRNEIAEEILSESVVKLKRRYPDAPISIAVPEEIVIVPMDAMLIEQVIMNLLENAIRHSETATKIELMSFSKSKKAFFLVKDNGVGISEDLLPYLFNGLSRTNKNPRIDATKDMGIGLSVCYSIIHAHNGDITAYNNPEGGACFSFWLPLNEEDLHA